MTRAATFSSIPPTTGSPRSSTTRPAGRPGRPTDAAGTVTATHYDGASRATMMQTGDRVTRYLYDRDGLMVGEVTPLGFLPEHSYAAGGQRVGTARYSRRSRAAANLSAPVWMGVSHQPAIAGKP